MTAPHGATAAGAARAGASAPLLEVADLRVRLRTPRGPAEVVNGLSYTVGHGETVAVVGESGSGKSVSVLALMGLLPARSATVTGRALLQGEDLLTMPRERLRRVRGPGVGMVFQDPMTSLNPVLTVGRQLVEGIRAHTDLDKKAARDRAADLLGEVGLPDPRGALDRYPHELSGGQRQRVGIARALALEPEFIVCDEPVSALDVSIQAQIINILETLQENLDLTYLFIAHDLAVVRHISDRVAVMYLGRIMELADRDSLYDDPQHPYTKALLDAVPIPDPVLERQRKYNVLTGEVPSPLDPPKGCVFNTRCPLASEECRHEVPPLREVKKNHYTACIKI